MSELEWEAQQQLELECRCIAPTPGGACGCLCHPWHWTHQEQPTGDLAVVAAAPSAPALDVIAQAIPDLFLLRVDYSPGRREKFDEPPWHITIERWPQSDDKTVESEYGDTFGEALRTALADLRAYLGYGLNRPTLGGQLLAKLEAALPSNVSEPSSDPPALAQPSEVADAVER